MAVYRSPEERWIIGIRRAAYGLIALLLLVAIVTRGSFGLGLAFAVLAIWMLILLATGFRRGEMEPLTRGGFGPFRRVEQPLCFWLSTAWNFGWMAIGVYGFVSGVTNMGAMNA